MINHPALDIYPLRTQIAHGASLAQRRLFILVDEIKARHRRIGMKRANRDQRDINAACPVQSITDAGLPFEQIGHFLGVGEGGRRDIETIGVIDVGKV